MKKLTPLMRNAVRLYVDFPRRAMWRLVKAAGYQGTPGSLRVAAHRVFHDPKVIAAIAEETARRSPLDAALSRATLRDLTLKKSKQQLRAATALGDRTGFAAEQKHIVEHRDESVEAKIEKLRQLAAILGVDPATLIGGNMKLIEARLEPAGE